MSFSQSIICPSHAASAEASLALLPSLYRQWAAMPYFAVRCMSRCGSGSRAACPGPTTVVCSDWYMLDLGIAT